MLAILEDASLMTTDNALEEDNIEENNSYSHMKNKIIPSSTKFVVNAAAVAAITFISTISVNVIRKGGLLG